MGDGVGGALDEQASLCGAGLSSRCEGGVGGGIEGKGQGLVTPPGLASKDGLLAGCLGDGEGAPAAWAS